MTGQITLQYPSWYLLLCILIAFSLAGFLYYRQKRFSEEHKWLPFLLFALRFLLIASIAFFLLSPMIRKINDNVQQPIVVIGKDVSQSVINGMSDTEVDAFNDNLNNLAITLGEKYDIRTFSFGDEIVPFMVDSFTQKVSNLSRAMEYIENNYADQNLGAVIIASDGIYNEGRNPVYNLGRISAPIYTVALGDTTEKTDLVIREVFANNIVYLGDRFSIQADVKAVNSKGRSTVLRLYHESNEGNKLLQEETISIDSDDFFTTKEYIINAEEPGVIKYRLTVSPIAGEVTRGNNARDIYIQVLDARQKILILICQL